MNRSVQASRPIKVLVVEDDLAARNLLTEGLEFLGYAARAVATAEEAFEIVLGGGVPLILADIAMPGENGVDLLRKVKAHDDDVDVVMVTGLLDLGTAIGTIREGACDYLPTPFNLEQVRVVVERTLEKRRLVLQNRAHQQGLEQRVAERTREAWERQREIETLYLDLQNAYESTLQALVTALDFRDNETQGHSSRVVEYAAIIARNMGVEEPELSWIRQGAFLHDVGKIGVPDAILKKPGKLSPEEWEEMKKHPEMGYRMLQHVRFLTPALDIVLCHQERWDGKGYPRGLKAEQIPLGARIFPVVDTLDAMTSDRPYRRALSIEAAREEVRRFSGTQFDPRVAEVFLSIEEETWREIREQVHRQLVDLEEHVRRALGRSHRASGAVSPVSS